ncbi:MAG: TIR domain-containing protein [Alphaproteobacteria bacterium]|nr:TIR domain-containing protein [Alphaproteobacteria bacterium]
MSDFKYRAFISYAHADESIVSGLHTALELYRIPKALVRLLRLRSRHIRPIFRDREELSPATNLTGALQNSLDQSEFLIVACSSSASSSSYVEQEIRYFKQAGRSEQIFTVIVDGADGEQLFPPALLHETTDKKALGALLAEPLAADLRPIGDGEQAVPKLIASILGVPYDDLVKRHASERRRKLQTVAAATTIGMLFAASLAIYAIAQREVAEAQKAIAELETKRSLQVVSFLVDTFRVADPATENPREVTALEILERGRARLDGELLEQPRVRATLLTAIGKVYQNLGLHDESAEALAYALILDDLPSTSRIDRHIALAGAELDRDRFDEAKDNLASARGLLAITDEQSESIVSLEARLNSTYGFLSLRFGDYESAKEALVLGVELLDRAYGPDRRETIAARALLGSIYLDFEEYEEAEPLLLSALINSEQLLGEAHSQTNEYRTLVARVMLETDRELEAIELLKTSIRELVPITGRNYPGVAGAYMHLGRAYNQLGRFAHAQEAFDDALEIGEAIHGASHGFNGVVHIFASLTATRVGAVEVAHRRLDQAESIFESLFSSDHVLFGMIAAYRGVAFGAIGKIDGAVSNCRYAMTVLGESAHYEAELCSPWLSESLIE